MSRDGSVELMSAVQDLGAGTKTILAQVVGEEFGMPPANVVIRVGDTRFPIGPDSGGSVTAGSITPAVRNAAYQAKQKLFAAVAPALAQLPTILPCRMAAWSSRTMHRSHTP